MYKTLNMIQNIYEIKIPQSVEESKSSKCANDGIRAMKVEYDALESESEWNQKLDEVLKRIGFKACSNAQCLYRMSNRGNLCLIVVYADDLIISCQVREDLLAVKAEITNNFECVEKYPISYFLGFEITRDGEKGSIEIGKKLYIREIFEK